MSTCRIADSIVGELEPKKLPLSHDHDAGNFFGGESANNVLDFPGMAMGMVMVKVNQSNMILILMQASRLKEKR